MSAMAGGAVRPAAIAGGPAAAPATAAIRAALRRDARTYTSCYCEENVFNLFARGHLPAERSYAVFVSNEAKAVAVFHQSVPERRTPQDAAEAAALSHRAALEDVVVWDYHVLAAVAPNPEEGDGGEAGSADRSWRIFDLDSRLPWGCELGQYCAAAFRQIPGIRETQTRRFRVVPAVDYLSHFASDRRHMRTPDGGFSSPPPAYPPHSPAREASSLPEDSHEHNLDRWLDMTRDGTDSHGVEDGGPNQGSALWGEVTADLEAFLLRV